MKRRIFLMAALVAGIGLASCSVDTSGLEEAVDDLDEQLDEATDEVEDEMDEADTETESTSSIMYQCPTNCENGPAYPDPGPCKVCGEEMIEI